MRLEDYLQSVQLMDCTGRTTHTLTLMLDGRVSVRVGAVEVVVDPVARVAMPASCRLGAGEYGHQQVIELACDLAAGRLS